MPDVPCRGYRRRSQEPRLLLRCCPLVQSELYPPLLARYVPRLRDTGDTLLVLTPFSTVHIPTAQFH